MPRTLNQSTQTRDEEVTITQLEEQPQTLPNGSDPQGSWTISIDAGGTFTDAVAHSATGETLVAKVASTPDDPSKGLSNAVNALAIEGLDLSKVSLVCHGTTVATNATLTNTMARVALITTKGFRDVLAYRQGSRPDVYSLRPQRPNELVDRADRFEVDERIASNGTVITPLEETELDEVVSKIVEAEPEAVAVSLLFSYLNDTHERRIAEALRKRLPDVPITISSDVAREFREYPRTATTVVNAALRPIVGQYLQRAAKAINEVGVSSPLQVMLSNGGGVPAERASEQAHRMILSGPVAGVSSLISGAEEHGLSNVISLDMGGTSVDVCLVRDGKAPYTSLNQVQDHTLIAPSVDIHTIGAGGGSIAWVDRTERLRVGPQSARAVPGPACYGRGGTEATLTDAHVVLGNLGTDNLAGGLSLDLQAAREAVGRVGERLDMNVEEAAEAIIAISLAQMVRAVRKVSVERGLDLREFSLFPFGGAGPLHAGMLLRHLNLASVVVPRQPGLYSADGLLAAGIRVDDSQTVLKPFTEDGLTSIAEWLQERKASLHDQVIRDGALATSLEVLVTADARYLGQGYELEISLDGTSTDDLSLIAQRFHDAHRELYGHASPDEPVEIVTVRIAVTGALERSAAKEIATGSPAPAPQAVLETRPVRFADYGTVATPVYQRAELTAGNRIEGPAVLVQMDATTVILPGQHGTVQTNGDVIVTENDKS